MLAGSYANNTGVIQDKAVSRRHPVVHFQGNGKYLLVDLRSTNGTLLNNRYLHKPTLLKDLDRSEIAKHTFQFRCSPNDGGEAPSDDVSLPYDQKTVASFGLRDCWLLAADIKGFTQMSLQHLSGRSQSHGRTLASLLRRCDRGTRWFDKQIPRRRDFLAYWFDTGDAFLEVARAVDRLSKNQNSGSPEFRMVIHYGTVALGGASSSGEESILRPDLNYTFRMEKVASSANALLMFNMPAYNTGPNRLRPVLSDPNSQASEVRHLFYSIA